MAVGLSSVQTLQVSWKRYGPILLLGKAVIQLIKADVRATPVHIDTCGSICRHL